MGLYDTCTMPQVDITVTKQEVNFFGGTLALIHIAKPSIGNR